MKGEGQGIITGGSLGVSPYPFPLYSNGYYGELWGSLMHREMQEWMTEYRSRDSETTPPTSKPVNPPSGYVPCEGESVLEIDRSHIPASVTNLVEIIHTG